MSDVPVKDVSHTQFGAHECAARHAVTNRAVPAKTEKAHAGARTGARTALRLGDASVEPSARATAGGAERATRRRKHPPTSPPGGCSLDLEKGASTGAHHSHTRARTHTRTSMRAARIETERAAQDDTRVGFGARLGPLAVGAGRTDIRAVEPAESIASVNCGRWLWHSARSS